MAATRNPRKYWVIIDKQGDSYFTEGSAVPYEEFEEERKKVLDRGGKPPTIRIRFEEPPGNGNGKLLPALKPFDPYKFAEYVLRNNVFSDADTFVYSGLSGTNPHGVPDHIWTESLASMGGEFVKTGDLYVVKTPEVERPPTMRAAPTWREVGPLMSTEPSSPNPTRFTKGQPIVIKSKAIYGWRAWVTVKKDDPEHKQVWVKEIPRAVKYEDIEEEEEYEPDLNASTIDLLAATEGDPLRKFCCRQCGECAPTELLEEGRFPDRIAWLRHHYKEKHPGRWGKMQLAVIPTQPSHERARTLWTRESTQHRIEILRKLSLEEHHFASPWNKLPVEYRDRLATYYETQQKQPAVIPTQPSPPSPKQELEFVSDSPEYLAFTIEDIGYREKLDTAFETAIARAKGG